MVQIKAAFIERHHKSLGKMIASECSGDYKKILLDLTNEN